MRWTTMEDRQPRLAELGVSVSLPRVSYSWEQSGQTVRRGSARSTRS